MRPIIIFVAQRQRTNVTLTGEKVLAAAHDGNAMCDDKAMTMSAWLEVGNKKPSPAVV